MADPVLSFIVTAWGQRRPLMLPVLLASLQAQSFGAWESLVLDSEESSGHAHLRAFQDKRFYYFPKPLGRAHERCEMYHVTEWGIKQADGEWVCFPNDDSYYCPWFAERMLAAAERDKLDLALCDMVLGSPASHGVINSQPLIGAVDKCNFIVRRSIAQSLPFPGKDNPSLWQVADGAFVEAVARSGARWGKVEQVLCVHN